MFIREEDFFFILKILFFLVPISIISGPFLPDLFVVLFCLTFITYVIKFNEWKYFNNFFSYFLIIFNIYIIIISLFSNNPFLSLESSLFYFRFFLFSLGTWVLLQKNILNFKLFFFILLIIFILVSFDAYIQFFFENNIFGQQKQLTRISGIFGEELILGSFLSRMYPLFFAISFYLSKENKGYLATSMLLFIVIDVLIFLTGERTAFLLLILHLLLILVLVKSMRLLRLGTFVISILLITFLTTFFPGSKDRMIDDTISQLNIDKVISNLSSDITDTSDMPNNAENLEFWDEKKQLNRILAFSPHHELTYQVSFKIFLDNYFFGIGTKMFREYCNYPEYYIEYGCTTHPHNSYLQFLVELGVIGFLFLACLFIFICYLFFKKFIHNLISKNNLSDMTILFLAPIFINLWPIAPSGNFFNNWLSVLYYLPVGFALYFYSKEKT